RWNLRAGRSHDRKSERVTNPRAGTVTILCRNSARKHGSGHLDEVGPVDDCAPSAAVDHQQATAGVGRRRDRADQLAWTTTAGLVETRTVSVERCDPDVAVSKVDKCDSG